MDQKFPSNEHQVLYFTEALFVKPCRFWSIDKDKRVYLRLLPDIRTSNYFIILSGKNNPSKEVKNGPSFSKFIKKIRFRNDKPK
jgi:hypothetical protein